MGFDLAIPLAAHTDNNFLDLRYALRSFELYLKPSKVYLIGAKPDWVKNVEHIPATDHPDTAFREANIFHKLILCPSEEFIYGSDDNYLLRPFVEEYPWDMLLAQKLYTMGRFSTYQKTIANTLRLAPHEKNYDGHAPITMRRDILYRIRAVKWDLPYGYCMKSLYAQVAGIKGVQYPDMKLRAPFLAKDIKGRKWFSTADGVVDKMVPLMDKLYKKKSIYE